MSSLILYNLDYVDYLDNKLAAILLSQIVYWYLPSKKNSKSKLRVCKIVEDKAIWWLVKSHNDWYKELRFSREESRGCIRLLESRKILETTVYRFNNIPTQHIRLICAGGNSVLYKIPEPKDFEKWSTGCQQPTQLVVDNQSTGCQQPISLVPSNQPLTETTTENTTETTLGLQKPQTKPNPIGNNMKSNEVKEEYYKSKENKVYSSMEMKWKGTLALISKKYQYPVGVKERSLLKKLATLLGKELAYKVIEWSIENWDDFAEVAAAVDGVSSYPSSPHIAFLYSHHAYVVNKLKLIESKPKELPKTELAEVIIKKEKEKEVPYKPTKQEIFDLLKSLE